MYYKIKGKERGEIGWIELLMYQAVRMHVYNSPTSTSTINKGSRVFKITV